LEQTRGVGDRVFMVEEKKESCEYFGSQASQVFISGSIIVDVFFCNNEKVVFCLNHYAHIPY
jgi:hypothetical protein